MRGLRLLAVVLPLAVLAVGCRGGPPAEPTCPPGMLLVPGGTFTLGEDDAPENRPHQFNAVIREVTVDVATFCVDEYPAPNRAGAPWPRGGLGAADAAELDRELGRHGRRLCRVRELLLAAAGPANHRYPYDATTRRDGACDPSDVAPQPLGSFPACVSPTGARDFGVRSAWGRLDPPLRAHLEAYGAPNRPPHLGGGLPAERRYAVYGGIGRTDTFYASTNFGIHAHDPEEGPTQDDWFRVCRDPTPVDPAEEAAHRAWMGAFVAGR